MNEYTVIKTGRTYGLYSRTSRCIVVYGGKRALETQARLLNAETRPQ